LLNNARLATKALWTVLNRFTSKKASKEYIEAWWQHNTVRFPHMEHNLQAMNYSRPAA